MYVLIINDISFELQMETVFNVNDLRIYITLLEQANLFRPFIHII